MIHNLGRYEIISELGRGAMGVVYKARDPLIDRLVAIKTINLQSLPPEKRKEYEARFYQEAKAAGRLSHPNIITVHDLGETHGIAYIAMELLEGKELQHLIEDGKHLSVDEALNIAIQVAAGLAYAHEHGVIHRDIKPSNIMVLKGKRVKIADFGIARMETSLLSTQTGMVMGSPLYMSPEQIKSERIDFRSDIFSLGIVLYQMLTGKLPFGGDNAHSVMYQIVQEDPPKPSSLNSDVPDSLDTIISKCLAKSPVERYQDANELGKALLFCYQSSHTHTGHYLQSLIAGSSSGKMTKWKILGLAVLLFIVFEIIEILFF
jgi:eukaryotic-like serine/threonine-protein kinase